MNYCSTCGKHLADHELDVHGDYQCVDRYPTFREVMEGRLVCATCDYRASNSRTLQAHRQAVHLDPWAELTPENKAKLGPSEEDMEYLYRSLGVTCACGLRRQHIGACRSQSEQTTPSATPRNFPEEGIA